MGIEVVNEGSSDGGYVGELVPSIAEELSWGALVSRQAVEDELDMIMRAMREFWSLEPDQVGRMIQAMSARCTEMAVHLHRLETRREFKQIRTLQVQPVLEEMKRQWAIASRLVEIRRQDVELMK